MAAVAPLASALLLVLAFPPFDQGWLAWVSLLPWLSALERLRDPRRAFAFSCLAGLVFFGGTVWWVGHVTIPGTVILVGYLALFFGAWGWYTARMIGPSARASQSSGGWTLLGEASLVPALPAGWVVMEFLRSWLLSGFGWNPIAHTQWKSLPLIQVADLTGMYGVSFLVVLVNVGLWLTWRRGSGLRALAPTIAATLLLAAALGYGSRRMVALDSAAALSPALRVAVLQGNIPQTQKWDEAYRETIWRAYEARLAEAGEEGPDLIVWPETAVPGFLGEPEVAARLLAAAEAAGRPMLVGVPTEREGRLYNSAILVAADGRILDHYDKLHLVPFGEFIPLKPLFRWLGNLAPIGDFSPGDRATVFRLPAGRGHRGPRRHEVSRNEASPFSVLICFEDLFPGLARRFVREGAQGLLVITNDAWFGRSAASLQHLQASVFRAVEGRVWVGRAANTGWSGFVDAAGRVLPAPGQVPRFEPGVAVAEVSAPPGPGPYVRWGEWFPIVCALVAASPFLRRKKPLS